MFIRCIKCILCPDFEIEGLFTFHNQDKYQSMYLAKINHYFDFHTQDRENSNHFLDFKIKLGWDYNKHEFVEDGIEGKVILKDVRGRTFGKLEVYTK